MPELLPSMIDRFEARVVYEWLSGVCAAHPFAARHVVGRNPIKWWYASGTPANLVEWQIIERDPGHGRDPRPVSFEQAGVLSTSARQLREQRWAPGADPAVAFAVGSRTVAGLIQGSEQVVTGDLKVGLRVGSEALSATIGLFDLATRTFEPARMVDAIAQHVPVGDFAAQFPRVPLQ